MPWSPQLKQDIYRIKKKSVIVDISIGDCTSDPNVCDEACTCSCTNTCNCSENCTNRQYFQEQKKVKVIMTQHCGWGVEAVEFIKKDDYIIKYVGEVIDNALREMRFRDMKAQGITKFYMVQVGSNFNIDAKLKGGESRLIDHCCDQNCSMENWDVNGETRLGIFALRAIEPGEELTLDYRDKYEMYDRDRVKCRCGAPN
ncbi:histone-lysine N-methyltransferase ASHR3-like [Helianthus annuus]|uniref:histone-lysine N-methyltransferase ASHR3-like n=1 Tax=Helianthus annuus TaxID=4232 RepID=UPI001652E907|nr:histone-lysine N-methyltransferase ASHR3-like [Helianthus annuus]XP_035837060.1 histone-lysine N-methyltransferase ASHR3-like [Helianthus annuus]